MDLGYSGARESSVSFEGKVRNKQDHQFFPLYPLLRGNVYVSRRWKEWFPVSLQFFPDTTTTTLAGTGIGNIPWLPNNSSTRRESVLGMINVVLSSVIGRSEKVCHL